MPGEAPGIGQNQSETFKTRGGRFDKQNALYGGPGALEGQSPNIAHPCMNPLTSLQARGGDTDSLGMAALVWNAVQSTLGKRDRWLAEVLGERLAQPPP
jgi:hypothetical protein